MQKKQAFLRKEILDRQYDPQEFIEFLDSKLKIGDDLTLCSFDQLKSVVEVFLSLHNQEEEQSPPEEPKSEILVKAESVVSVVPNPIASSVKPRTILFVLFQALRINTISLNQSLLRHLSASRYMKSLRVRRFIAGSVSKNISKQSTAQEHRWIFRHRSSLLPRVRGGHSGDGMDSGTSLQRLCVAQIIPEKTLPHSDRSSHPLKESSQAHPTPRVEAHANS